MNQVVIAGKVSDLKKMDKFLSFTIEAGWGEWAQQIPVFFPAGKAESTENKKYEALKKWLENDGEIVVRGKLINGKQGVSVSGADFFVGKFKPYDGDGAKSSKSNKGGDDLGLPF